MRLVRTARIIGRHRFPPWLPWWICERVARRHDAKTEGGTRIVDHT